jgi:hypothetical protein
MRKSQSNGSMNTAKEPIRNVDRERPESAGTREVPCHHDDEYAHPIGEYSEHES